MKDNFARSLKAVLKHEGGYVNHPKDPGGATNKGITQATYDLWNEGTSRSVKNITDAEVEAIYKRNYWDKVRGDDLPAGVDYCVFDFAVNSGVSRSAKYLQTVLGVEVDGVIGPQTVKAAMEAEPRAVIQEICDRRMDFLQGLGTWPTFGKGWTNRVTGVKAMAMGMAGEPVQPDPVPEATSATAKLIAALTALGVAVAGLIAALVNWNVPTN